MTKIDRKPDKADFAHVTDWVFDLDNTLYPIMSICSRRSTKT